LLQNLAHLVVEAVFDRQFLGDDIGDDLRDRLRIVVSIEAGVSFFTNSRER
jgi:hypothetical protein